jgi:hypothetical protein
LGDYRDGNNIAGGWTRNWCARESLRKETVTTVLMLAGAFGDSKWVAPMLRGEVTAGNTAVPIKYNNATLDPESGSVDGARKLNAAILATTGPVVVMGHSLGSVSICRWLHDYGTKSSELAEHVSFICLANSRRRYGGFVRMLGWAPNSTIPVDTPFKVIDFARQYDGWCDWPADIWNIQAVLNAIDGQSKIHTLYNDVSLNDKANLKFTEGNVTYVLSPTALANESKRAAIEKGYKRPETGSR